MTAKKVEFVLNIAEEDLILVEKIIDRVMPMAVRAKTNCDRGFWLLTIARCHSIYSLDLEEFFTSDDRAFASDAFGILNYTEWRSGFFLDDGWRPACMIGDA